MIHANAVASQPRFAKNDQPLTRSDHFLHVMQIEPAADERLAERIRIRLVQCRFENLFPPAKPAQRSLDHLAAQTDRRVAFLARKFRKLMPIFVPSRIMREQIFHCLEAEPAQREQARARDPIEFSQRLRDFHHLGNGRRGDLVAAPRRDERSFSSMLSLNWPGLSQRFHLHFKQGLAFVFARSNTKGNVPWRRRQSYGCSVKINCAAMVIALAKAEDQVLVLHHARRRDRLHFAREKKRLRISVAEWLQHLVPKEKIGIEFGKREFMVKSKPRLQIFIGQKLPRRATKRFREKVDILLLNRQSCRHLVPAVLVDLARASGQSFD